MNFAAHMETVARALLGEPNARLSKPGELRFGNNGSISVDLIKGTFVDHEANEGGGVLDLIERERGLTGKAAYDFMRELGCDVDDPPRAKGNGAANGAAAATKSRKKAAAVFPYRDETGAVLFEIIRYHFEKPDGSLVINETGKPKKTFLRRRPDPDRPGEYIWNVEGVRDIPYRMDDLVRELKASPDDLVFITEGEAKADVVWNWDLIGTTNAGGAEKWNAQHAAFLRGAHVAIIPDHDQPGRNHRDKIGASLRGIAASVRVLELPGLPPKGDILDWKADGGTRVQFLELAEQAKEWKPSQQDASGKPAPNQPGAVSLDDFYAYLPSHSYLYTPTREMWPAASINARIPPVALVDAAGQPVLNDKSVPEKVRASTWLDQNRAVEQMTWAPGEPMVIRDRLVDQGGWITRAGASTFNLYRPPAIVPGDAAKAGPWLDHARKIYADNADHIIKYFAHRVQRPHEKINHALVLGGTQGIGKDTMLEPVKRAVGPWNFQEVSPQHMLGRFNGFLKSIILRVSEARDLGDINRYQFYDHMKAYTAAPPDVLRVDEKNLREHSVLNCVGVVITTNHKADGIFLPADDRRHFVAWSDLTKDDFAPSYWNTLWRFYDDGGDRHVAAYLAELDLSDFDPKAPPPKTPAFWDIVDANRAPEDAELADVLDAMGKPDATTIAKIIAHATDDFGVWLRDRKNRRVIPHRLEKCGYAPVRYEGADGLWPINGKRQAIYAKSTLSVRDRYRAATDLLARDR